MLQVTWKLIEEPKRSRLYTRADCFPLQEWLAPSSSLPARYSSSVAARGVGPCSRARLRPRRGSAPRSFACSADMSARSTTSCLLDECSNPIELHPDDS